jgi:hypothetical protein
MKKIWGLGSLVVACSIGCVQIACSSGKDSTAQEETGESSKLDDLIGSVSVDSKSLDGIGTIGMLYEYSGGFGGSGGWTSAGAGGAFAAGSPSFAGSPSAGGAFSGKGDLSIAAGSGPVWPGGSVFYANCTGTLISKNSVLTTRDCAYAFDWQFDGQSLAFGIGADGNNPTRTVKVVDVEYAPIESGSSLAVLHLAESLPNIAPFPVAVLADDQVGTVFAGIGFGNSDLRYQSGQRRAGALTLRGNSGLLYPLIFGDFEAYFRYITGGYPGGVAGSGSGAAGSSLPFPGAAGAAFAGSPGDFAGSGGASAGAGGGGFDYREYFRQQYNSVTLAPTESYAGGGDSDAQPCGADAGGPLLRKAQGKVRVFGAFERTPFGSCEKGGLYARITPATKAFVDAAAQWTDPCGAVSTAGQCSGNTAVRCSKVGEGKRRLVKFDCNLLNQACVSNGVDEVACTDK